MATRTSSTTSCDKVRAERKRLGQQGLRPIQIWVPDVSSPGFAKPAHRQSRFDGTKSITICPFTTNPADGPRFRLTVEPHGENGLRTACRLVLDKVTTVPKSKLREKIGRLADQDMVRLNRAMLVFPGIAAPREQVATSATSFRPAPDLLRCYPVRCDNDPDASSGVPVLLWKRCSAAIRI